MNAPTSNGTLTATFPVFLEHLETLRLEASAPGALQVRGYIQNRGKDGTSAGGQIQIPLKISNSIQIELPNSPLFIQTRLSKWTPFRDSWPWAMKPKPPHPFRVRFVRHGLAAGPGTSPGRSRGSPRKGGGRAGRNPRRPRPSPDSWTPPERRKIPPVHPHNYYPKNTQ